MPSSPIRLVRNATYEILDTIAGVSTASIISVAKARTATLEVCKQKYLDIYELELPKESDKLRKKKPRTAEDCQPCANVLPSETSVNNFKHKKAFYSGDHCCRSFFLQERNQKSDITLRHSKQKPY